MLGGVERWDNNTRERENCDGVPLVYPTHKLLGTLTLAAHGTEV